MWRIDAYQIPYYSRGIEGEKRTHPRFVDCRNIYQNSMDHGARRLKYKYVEITECKLYMRVDDTKITRGTIQCLWHEEYRIQNARPCVEKMQFIFFVPPNEELEGTFTLHPQKFGCTPKNEVKGYMYPQMKKPVGMLIFPQVPQSLLYQLTHLPKAQDK